MTTRKDKTCINPKCTRRQHARGLCNGCYATAWRMISDGRVTEERLIETGRMQPINTSAVDRAEWMEEVAV